ncbi:MAG: hypothetical protein ACOC10_07935 [Bacteroidota bacterium]
MIGEKKRYGIFLRPKTTYLPVIILFVFSTTLLSVDSVRYDFLSVNYSESTSFIAEQETEIILTFSDDKTVVTAVWEEVIYICSINNLAEYLYEIPTPPPEIVKLINNLHFKF